MSRIVPAVLVFLTIASASRAHEGPRVWIGNEAGRVVTYSSDNDLAPTTYTPSRLFMGELEPFFGIYTTEFPGYEIRRDGGGVSPNSIFGFNIAGALLFYDDVTQSFMTVQERFGTPLPGPVPQIAVTLGTTICQSGAAPVAGFNFFEFEAIGDHAHLAYTLLGDGVTASNGPSGVYALPLELTSSALATSPVYYLLLGKDVEMTDPLFVEARTVALATLVADEVVGDVNCSGGRDHSDITDFALALVDPDAFAVSHPGCPIARADLDHNGVVDGRDVLAMTDLFAP